MAWTPPPEPTYERDVERLIRYYKQAAFEIVQILNSAVVEDLNARRQKAILKQIEEILLELDNNAKEWIDENIPKAYQEGQAAALISLGVAASMKDALLQISFTRLNKTFIEVMISDTYEDLLQATNNTRRQVKKVIRQVVAEQMRSRVIRGVDRKEMTRAIIKELRDKLGEAARFAIRDRANRVWRLEDYVDVVVRTKIQQSHIEGVRNQALQRGALYGIISTHHAVDACRFHEGRIVKLVSNAPGPYPTIEQLRASGQIFHPRCRHVITAIRDPSILPDHIRERAERQAQIGDRALATGKRNPTEDDLNR